MTANPIASMTSDAMAIAEADAAELRVTIEHLHGRLAIARAEAEMHLERIDDADQRARSFEAALTAEREASKGLVAQAEALRAAAAESEYAFRNASKQLSVALDERDDARRITSEAWNARDAALALANLHQSDAERQTRELAKLRAELAELRARPVLTDERLREAMAVAGLSTGAAPWVLAALGPVTLPSPDAAAALWRAFVGVWNGIDPCRLRDVDYTDKEHESAIVAMRAALAKLSPAPAREVAPTERLNDSSLWLRVGKAITAAVDKEREAILSEMGGKNTTGKALPDSASLWPRQWNAAARAAVEVMREVAPTLVAVSDEDLVAAYYGNNAMPLDVDERAGIRAVRAKLGAAEVTEERLAAALRRRFPYAIGDAASAASEMMNDLRATAAKGG